MPTLVTPSDSEKAEGVTGDQSRCIIETDLTVADLAATNIKAINALIDKLTASRIEVDTLFAREAVTGALDSYLVRTSTIEALEGQLNVWANDKIILAVKDKVDTSTYNTGMAGKADASDLTALSGRVTTAETSITQNANAITSKASQSDFDALTGRVTTAESEIEQTPTKITAAVNAVEVGGTNMVRLGGLSIVNAGGSANEYLGRDWYRASEHQTTISAYDSTCWLQCPDIVITAGKQYTLSYYAWIQPGATAGANTFRPNLWGGTDDTDKYLTDLIPFVVGTPTKYSVTFDTTGWTTGTYTLRFVMLTGQTHEVYFTDIKLEEGTKATAWSPNPAEVRICSSILMDADHTEINTPYLDIDVSGTEGDMHIDENGISAGTATFGAINCSGVVRTYTGATAVTLGSGGTYGTMAALAEVINHSKLPDGLTVTVTSDIYGDCTLNGFYADNAVTFNFAGHSYNGALYIRNCQAQSMTFNSMVYNGTGSDLALCIYKSSYVHFSACTFNFNNNPADSMGIYNGSDICMDGCGLYNGKYFIYLSGCAQLEMINCLGGNCTNFLGAHGGLFKARGTRPDGGVYDPGLCLMRPSDPTTLTVDSGSATPAVDPVTTTSYTASVTGTYYPSGHWIGDNVIRQGHEGTGSSGRKDYGCMWFSASALSGKTIKSATLTIKRIAGKGRSSEVTMKLWTTTVTGKSGTMASSTLASLGEIGTIGNGETVTVAIPTSAISTIASGGGLVLYTEETANKTGKTYSEHYAHFEGTDGAAPVLTATY